VTAGHKHWSLPVGPRTLRVLRVTVWRSRNVEKVDRSRFPYAGRTPDDVQPDDNGYWRLTLLGFLHGLTGFCARVD
jgi:hypothetical protein